MKICIVIDHWFPNIGGGPVHVWQLSRRLKQIQGVYIEIVTSNLRFHNYPSTGDKEQSLKVTRLGREGSLANIVDRLFFLCHLFIYLMRAEFDILHVHPYSPLLIAKIVGLCKAKPVVVTIHTLGMEPIGLPRMMTAPLVLLDRLVTFRIKYDALIFVDRKLKHQESTSKRKFFIPNGVDVQAFDRISGKKRRDIFQFLFVGRFHRQKNLVTLVRAFAQFIKKGKISARLLLIGDGPEYDQIKSLIRLLEVEDKVFLPGVMRGARLVRAYKESKAFILPSRYEGYPLTILEAWAAKLPVAATKVGESQYLVRTGENGFLANDASLQSLVSLLGRVYRSKKLRRMGLNGYRFVKHSCLWERSAAATFQVYQLILHEKK